MRLFVLMMLLTSLAACSPHGEPLPVVQNGNIDLAQWDFEQRGAVTLAGDWHFWWRELVPVDELRLNTGPIASPNFFPVPTTWESAFENGTWQVPLPAQSYATYAVEIALPPQGLTQGISVWGADAMTAIEVFLLPPLEARAPVSVAAGLVAAEPHDMVPAQQMFELDLAPPLAANRVRLVMHLSNADHRLGGAWSAPKIGLHGAGTQQHRRDLIRSSAMIGILLVAALYHLSLFRLRRDDWASFWFGMTCAILAFRMLSTDQVGFRWFQEPSELRYQLLLRMEWFAMPAGGLALANYLGHLRPAHWYKKYLHFFVYVNVPALLMPWCVPLAALTECKQVFQALPIIGIFLGTLHMGLHARGRALLPTAAFGSLLVVCVAAVNDALYFDGVIDSVLAIHYALLFFVVTQSVLISHQFSKAFAERDNYQREILKTYHELEETLTQRDALLLETKGLEHEVAAASEQLVQADRLATLGGVVAGVAHDIANPTMCVRSGESIARASLATIEQAIDELLGENDSQQAREVRELLREGYRESHEALNSIRLGVDRVAAINDAIRNQARRDAVAALCSGREIFEECLTILASRIKEVEVELDCPEGVHVDCRRSQLGQVVTNLISNAVDAARKAKGTSAKIRVSATEHNRGVLVAVEDNGAGVPVAMREKILEPFFSTKEVGTGTGLGMPICVRIVEAHGGKLVVDNSPLLGGARFSFHLARSGRA